MKVGIITMHKVQNYGSVLQAYALQTAISELGINSEIIDYDFHTRRKSVSKRSSIRGLLFFLKDMLSGFPRLKQKRKFEAFYNDCYNLSKKSYDYDSLQSTPPTYDIYMVGSDQVWNPKHVLDDVSFLLSFVKDKGIKCSYSSSFATKVLPNEYEALYKSCLSTFASISVREQSSVKLVQELVGREPVVCCDPTMLLSAKQWETLAEKSQVNIGERYILVYSLYYMFDPYPEIQNIIDNVQRLLGYKVIYLNGRKEDYFKANSKVYKSGGPLDFLSLIKNAEFIITTSFHGSLFSMIFDKPFLGVIKGNNNSDDRIVSLLNIFGASKSLISYDSSITFNKEELLQLHANQEQISAERQKSLSYLESIINQ